MNAQLRQVGQLESRVDYLETELTQLNDLLMECGFSEGINTLKATALEILKQQDMPKEL